MSRHFPRIFLWHVVRNVRRHRLLALLNVLSVALGIAVYLAIQIANHSANRSFAAGIDLVAGKSHLEVRGDVDETLWPRVAHVAGVRAVTGLVEGVVTLPDFPSEYLRVLGIDVFSSEPFRTFQLSSGGQRLALEPWLGAGDGLAVTADFAQRAGLKSGDHLRVLVNSEVKTLTIVSLLDTRDSPGASQSRVAAMDIGWAQELFGKVGRLSSLQILLEDPNRGAAVAAAIGKILPPDLTAQPPRQRSAQVQSLLAAFQLNLTALSMVSLLVGVFLIYNTISASVTRRRVEIGILRSLGATLWEVRLLFLGEACLFGVPGIVLGASGGVALAQVLSRAVAETISSHYVLLSIERSFLDPLQFAVAGAFGIGSVLVGSWMPANEAARIDPVGALSLGTRAEHSLERAPRLGRLALLVLGGAAVAAWWVLRSGPPAVSFVAAFLVLCGFSLFAPAAVRGFGSFAAGDWRAELLRRQGHNRAAHPRRRLVHPPTPSSPLRLLGGSSALQSHSILWRMAADHLRRSIHRNSVTVAALAAALAMTIGLTVMIFSFRQTVSAWVQHGIVADVFIAPSSNETIGLSATVPPAALEWLRARPEIAAVDTFREFTVPIRINGAPATSALLAVVEGQYRHNLTVAGGGDVRKMQRVFGGGAIAVSEPFARKFRVREGDRVTLVTPRGEVPIEIAAVYADYTRDQGVMLMSAETYARWWQEKPPAQSLAVYLRTGAAPDEMAEAFRQKFSRAGEFAIYSNRALRSRIFAIFDQTFAVTYILRTVAFLVAIAGIFLSVTTLVAEREREIGVLRAIGASRGQVQWLLMLESGMIGLVASALGLASGLALAATLTWVVNPAFFGWSIHLQLPWSALAATPVWIVVATLFAAWYPAWRGSLTPIAAAVREE